MNPALVLFFTRGVSLRTWSMLGMLDREVALYKRLCRWGFDVSFVTYGDARDREYEARLEGIRVLCNTEDLPLDDYEKELSSGHGCELQRAHVFKTNQTYGSEVALLAARLFGKPLVARCGYMWSKNAEREHGYASCQATEARRVEEKVFAAADHVVVTTDAMRLDIAGRIPAAASKVSVIPNYVDTDMFRPLNRARDRNMLLFVGRIAMEKNLESLLEAVEPLDAKVVLIGEGRLRPELQVRFGSSDGRVTWEGNVPNSTLPEYFSRIGLFVLPSLYEGHPKVLIEAMSCGTPVLGADSPGIRELINHGQTGYLCSTDTMSIRSSITDLLAQPQLCDTLGLNARRFVLDHYSLNRIAEIEAALLLDLIRREERTNRVG
ncbi:MAG: glycosyltransferase family 4 protein [Deltaproteobacteria bacterium]|nr:glycosyltransferase family 4 protein [Deltaproteobacteria bacterium]